MLVTGLGNIEAGLFGTNQFFQAEIKTTLTFLENVGLVHEDLVLNEMDFYNISKNVVDGKVKFLSPTTPSYITKEKPIDCSWDPVGGITYGLSEASLVARNIQSEQCPYVVPCWESLFGSGNDVESWTSTDLGLKLIEDLVKGIYRGIGNDLYKQAVMGMHPIIALAESSYTGDPSFYTRLKRTLNLSAGWMTLIDELSTTKGGQWAVPIHSSDVSGKKYIGNPVTLFNRLKDHMPAVFRAAAKQYKSYGIRPCILVTPSIFRAYQDYLMTQYTAFPDMLYYRMSNEFTALNGLNNQAPAPGVLGWDDFWIKEMDALDVICEEIQVTHHRATMVMPKILGLGLDIGELSGFRGMGLRMEQSTLLKEMGKIYMSTNYKMAAVIIDSQFVVNASKWSS